MKKNKIIINTLSDAQSLTEDLVAKLGKYRGYYKFNIDVEPDWEQLEKVLFDKRFDKEGENSLLLLCVEARPVRSVIKEPLLPEATLYVEGEVPKLVEETEKELKSYGYKLRYKGLEKTRKAVSVITRILTFNETI